MGFSALKGCENAGGGCERMAQERFEQGHDDDGEAGIVRE